MSEASVTDQEFEAFMSQFQDDPVPTEPEEAVEAETGEQEEPEDAIGEEVTEDALQEQEEGQEEVADEEQGQEDGEVTIDDLASLFETWQGEQVPKGQQEENQPEQETEQNGQPQQQPGWVPEVSSPSLDGNRFDEVMSDVDEFNKFLAERDQAVAAGVMNELANTVPHWIANISSLVVDSKNIMDGFLKKYPRLEKLQPQVYNTIGRIMNQNPGMSRSEATAQLEKEMDVAIRVGAKGAKRVDARDKHGRGSARTNSRTSTPQPASDAPVDSTEQAFAIIAEKNRG